MSKNKKIIFALLAAIVLLSAAVVTVILTAPSEAPFSDSEDETIYIYSFSSSEFVSASVTNGDGGYTLLKDGDIYTVSEAAHLTQDTYYTGWIGDKLCALNASKLVKNPSSDMSEYGLSEPLATCVISLSDGSSKTLSVGSAAPSGGYYMKLSDSGSIYIVSSNLPVYLLKSAAWFVETDIIPSPDDYDGTVDTSTTHILVGGKARSEAVEIGIDPAYDEKTAPETDTPYKMFRPVAYDVNASTVSDLFTYASSISFSECVSIDVGAQNLAALGLDDPDYTLSYTFADRTVDMIFADAGDYCYALLAGTDAVFTVYPTYTSFLSTAADDYMSRITFGKSIKTVSGITVSSADGVWEFDVSHTDDTLLPFYGSLALDETNFKQFYENLIMTLSEGRAEHSPSGIAPYLTVSYSFNDGSPDVVTEFVPVDGNMRYVYLVDGEGFFFVLKSQVESIIADARMVAANEMIKTTI